MRTEKDKFVRMRALLSRKHTMTVKRISVLELRIAQFGMTADKEELLLRKGERMGTCYALKCLDKACQIEAFL
jgi:hypothetical protein